MKTEKIIKSLGFCLFILSLTIVSTILSLHFVSAGGVSSGLGGSIYIPMPDNLTEDEDYSINPPEDEYDDYENEEDIPQDDYENDYNYSDEINGDDYEDENTQNTTTDSSSTINLNPSSGSSSSTNPDTTNTANENVINLNPSSNKDETQSEKTESVQTQNKNSNVITLTGKSLAVQSSESDAKKINNKWIIILGIIILAFILVLFVSLIARKS